MRLDAESDQKRLESTLKHLASWINPEAYVKVYGKGDSSRAGDRSGSYEEMLRKAGVSDDEINEFSPDKTTSDFQIPEDLDEVRVLKAPPTK